MATEKQLTDFIGDCNSATEKQYFVLCSSLYGCMPDSWAEYESFDDAKAAMIEALKDREIGYSESGEEDMAEIFCHLAEEANLLLESECDTNSPGASVVGGGHHFWIHKDTDPGYNEFSNQACDCCGGLPGERYTMEGYNSWTQEIEELGEICKACRYELEYGAGSFEE